MPEKSVEYYVYKYADKYKLDPKAVLAVASREGGIKWGGVGDGNTSFGPWQLHIGGALPKEYSTPEAGKAFANSEAGVEYAMRKMNEAGAGGLAGAKAIDVIVRKFERPRADLVEGEIQGAIDWYKGAGGAEPRLDEEDKLALASGGSEPHEAGNGSDTMRHSIIARVIETNALVAAGKLGQVKGISATDYLTMTREAERRGTSGMSDSTLEEGAKHGSTGNLINPLNTKMGEGSEYSTPAEFGAPDADGHKIHAGKDWFAPVGSPVVSPEGGKIIEVKRNNATTGKVFGGTVKVQNKDGRVYVFRHVTPAKGLEVGQRVDGGTLIAGVAPWKGGGEHAHIEVWKTATGGYNASNMIDPATLWSD
jgi:murein DD-endopeptidase MepM/ murein hydrolase activator NlpD